MWPYGTTTWPARSWGKSLLLQTAAFFISCFYAGVAGSLWAHLITVVNTEQFTLLHALEYVGMLIIGGMGSVPGVFFGSSLYEY